MIALWVISVPVVIALVFLRFPREPRWAGLLRLIIATLVVWNLLAMLESDARWHRLREQEATRSKVDRSFDTGGGAAMVLIGWIPAVSLVALLWGTRWCIIRLRRHENVSA